MLLISSRNTWPLSSDSSLHSVANGARLLVNLLEHEMLEAALFRHDRIPRDLNDGCTELPSKSVTRTRLD